MGVGVLENEMKLGEKNLEFAEAYDLAIVITFFRRRRINRVNQKLNNPNFFFFLLMRIINLTESKQILNLPGLVTSTGSDTINYYRLPRV